LTLADLVTGETDLIDSMLLNLERFAEGESMNLRCSKLIAQPPPSDSGTKYRIFDAATKAQSPKLKDSMSLG